MKTLSIIIVAYRAKDYLDRCLASIPRHRDWETIVIDNSSINQGFAKACNQGANVAQGTYLLFLNPDTLVQPGAIEQMLTVIQADKTIGILGPKLVDEAGNPYISATNQPTRMAAPIVYSFLNAWFKDNTWSRNYWYEYRLPKKQTEVGCVSGAALLIARTDYLKLKGFDDRMFMYWEDFDLCRRMQRLKKRVVYDPAAQIMHAREKSTRRDAPVTRSRFRDSRYRFFKKHFGMPYALGLEAWLTLQEEWRLMVILVLAIVLRFDRLWQLMPVIPDQARDFLAAWEALKTHTLPLLGIPSSLPQFHQGPLYVWWLMGLFQVFGPSALAAGYAAAVVGTLVVWVTYMTAEKWWGRRAAAIAGLIMATAPLAVVQARLAFMTNPIPLVAWWFFTRLNHPLHRGRDWWLLLFSFALLFQFELAAFPLIILVLIKLYLKHGEWRLGWKWAILGLLTGIWPQILYDVTHGFTQLGLFIGWVGYRVVRFWGVIPGKQSGLKQLPVALGNIGLYLTKFAGWDKPIFTLMLGVIGLAGGWLLFTKPGHGKKIIFPFAATLLLLVAYVIHGAPSEAYFPVLFVPIVWVLGWTVEQLRPGWRALATALIIGIALVNSYTLINTDYLVYTGRNLDRRLNLPYGSPLQAQEEIVDTLVHVTKGGPLHLMAIGPGSEFSSYLDNWRFLLLARNVTLSDAGEPVWFVFGGETLEAPILNAKQFQLHGVTFAVGR